MKNGSKPVNNAEIGWKIGDLIDYENPYYDIDEVQ